MSDKISNEKGFHTVFHTASNSGVKLPDYYKGETSTLSKARHQLVTSICNFIVYVQHHMKKRGWGDFKKITITDRNTKKEFDIYAHFAASRSQFFEAVHARLPRKFRPGLYYCNVENSDTWLKVCID
jgi:hypothetical protein